MEKFVIEEVVLNAHTKLMHSKNIEMVSDPSLEVRRRFGIDSLGIVTLIMDIEEALNIDLDAYLGEIRSCETIQEIIKVVEKAYVK